MNLIPTVIETTAKGSNAVDVFSRLLQDRIIFLSGPINISIANIIIAQLLYLYSLNPDEKIKMYINSGGGCVAAALAIYDTMKFIKCTVNTVCIGQACSAATLILAGGTKGWRYSLPNSRLMIHQPSISGQEGFTTAIDAQIEMNELIKIHELLNKLLAKCTGQSLKRINKDTERDYFMTAREAIEYGIIDHIYE